MCMRWAQGRLDLALLCFAVCSLHVHVFCTIGPFCELHRPKGPWRVPTAELKSLRAALVGCVLVTAVGGILSNPLFMWASSTVAGTPILQQAIAASGSGAAALG